MLGRCFSFASSIFLAIVIALLLSAKSVQTVSADCVPGNQVDKPAFFADLARQLRNPEVPESAIPLAVSAFLAWEPYENTAACWNPLATTLRYTGECQSATLPGNSAGVQEYPSRECGLRATAETLNYTFNGNGLAYQAIRRMLARQGFDEAALTQELRRWVGSEGYARAVVSRWQDLYFNDAGGPPVGYTFCAWENERCSFSGVADVAYGANGRFAYREGVRDGIDCANSVFGDPIYGVRKACYKQARVELICAPNADQVALFVDSHSSGQCVVKGYGAYGNPAAIGLPNDSLSSITVGPNVQAVLCEHDDYQGVCETFTDNDDNLSDNLIGNDRVSSLRVERRGQSDGFAGCPGQYQAEYFANRSLSGSPVLVRCEGWPIRHDWSGGSPGNSVPDDSFSVRWTGRARFQAGSYAFVARADDGIRVWLDESLIIDGWRDQPPTEYRITRNVAAGDHEVRIEFYENGGGALAEFRWEQRSTSTACVGAAIGLERRVEGRLSNATPSVNYCLGASAGQLVSIRMFALGNDGLDTFLRVWSTDGQRLTENDDGLNVGYNSFLSVRLPHTGIYRIEATRYGRTQGGYALRVDRGFEAAVGDLDRDCDVDNVDRDRLLASLGTTDSDADLDLDGVVTTRDATFQMRSLGVQCQ